MTIKINATGAERKRLVQTISAWLGEAVHYCGAPTFAYEIAHFTVEKNGSLTFSDLLDSEVIERLLQHIYDEGFDIDQSHTEDEDEEACQCQRKNNGQRKIRFPLLPSPARLHRCGIQVRTQNPAPKPNGQF